MLFLMKKRKSRIDLQIEKTEGFVNYLINRRRKSIQKSLIRPLYQEVLKCLFLVVILIVDTLIPIQIYLDFPDIINIIFALVALFIFLYFEILIYNLLWGNKGHWSIEKYNKNSEEI